MNHVISYNKKNSIQKFDRIKKKEEKQVHISF